MPGASASCRGRLPVLVASAEGYRNLCRVITRAKLQAPKGESSLTLDDFAGHTAGLDRAGRARRRSTRERHGVGGLVDRLVGLFGRGQVWIELQRHFRRDEQADAAVAARSGGGVSRAGDGVERRAVRDAGGAAALRRAHLHPAQDDARAGGAAADGECRAVSEAAGARWRGCSRICRRRSRAPRRWPSGSSSRSRISAIAFPTIRCRRARRRRRFCAGSRRSARAIATGRITTAPARRSRASSISSRSSTSPATSSSSGTSSISAGSRAFSCRAAGRRPTAPSATRSGITAVDPVGMDLLFERFLSEERGEWPDIDLDLPSGDRRERVIQYVYERYGTARRRDDGQRHHVSRPQRRARSRQGAGPRRRRHRSARADDEPVRVRRSGGDARAQPARGRPRSRRPALSAVRDGSGSEMQDLPRHLGQHSGGMVVCQGRLDEVVPLENASMPGRVVVQWDKDDCADLGIVKVDLLGLGHDGGARGGDRDRERTTRTGLELRARSSERE